MILSTQAPEVNGTNGTASKAQARLTPRHLAELRRSGLSDEQIVACGFHSLQTPDGILKALRWKQYRGDLGDCLAIPFFDAAGRPTDYCRLKPDKPRKGKLDCKPIRYESPKGSTNRAYIPPGTATALTEQTAPLLITEGEKKAAAADQEGIACVGLVGVYGWQKKRTKGADGKPVGERELIDDLASTPWQSRPVFLCFDSDAADNPHVRGAEWHLAETLQRRGAMVKIVRLPAGDPGPDGKAAKVGLDDFLVSRGPDAFRELLAEGTEPEPPPKGLAPIEAADDPHRLARLFTEERCQSPEGLTLRFYRDEWHRWDGTAWRTVPEKELRAEVTQSAKVELDRANIIAQKTATDDKPPPAVRKVTGRLVGDVAHVLQSLTILPGRLDAPAWLDGNGPFSATEVLACRNGLIHLPSLVANEDYFARPTPRFFSPTALDFDFNLEAPRPAAWWDFLGKLWPGDSASAEALQEWFGYCLTSDTSLQKILMLVGPKRAGKGVIARIMRALIGPANVVNPTLAGMATNFGLWPLLGKTLAVISDARLSGRTDAATVTERLLSISGEDSQTIDRKNLSPVTAKLLTRFMILTNELPKLGDSSGALPGRMILLRLTESWYGKEDSGLTEKLLAELPGILLWAIGGWQRLRTRGHFVQPDAGKGLVGELGDLSSPIGQFIRDRCHVGPAFQVEKATLYQSWKSWCTAQGRDHPGDAATFGRNLRAALPTLNESYPRTDLGRVYCYNGIGMT